MIALDTNVLVRLLTRDDEFQENRPRQEQGIGSHHAFGGLGLDLVVSRQQPDQHVGV